MFLCALRISAHVAEDQEKPRCHWGCGVCVCVWVCVHVLACPALHLNCVCSGDRLHQSARTRGASKGGCDRVVGVFGCTCACVCVCGCADVLQDYFI